jgi:hypothetical protein
MDERELDDEYDSDIDGNFKALIVKYWDKKSLRSRAELDELVRDIRLLDGRPSFTYKPK